MGCSSDRIKEDGRKENYEWLAAELVLIRNICEIMKKHKMDGLELIVHEQMQIVKEINWRRAVINKQGYVSFGGKLLSKNEKKVKAFIIDLLRWFEENPNMKKYNRLFIEQNQLYYSDYCSSRAQEISEILKNIYPLEKEFENNIQINLENSKNVFIFFSLDNRSLINHEFTYPFYNEIIVNNLVKFINLEEHKNFKIIPVILSSISNNYDRENTILEVLSLNLEYKNIFYFKGKELEKFRKILENEDNFFMIFNNNAFAGKYGLEFLSENLIEHILKEKSADNQLNPSYRSVESKILNNLNNNELSNEMFCNIELSKYSNYNLERTLIFSKILPICIIANDHCKNFLDNLRASISAPVFIETVKYLTTKEYVAFLKEEVENVKIDLSLPNLEYIIKEIKNISFSFNLNGLVKKKQEFEIEIHLSKTKLEEFQNLKETLDRLFKSKITQFHPIYKQVTSLIYFPKINEPYCLFEKKVMRKSNTNLESRLAKLIIYVNEAMSSETLENIINFMSVEYKDLNKHLIINVNDLETIRTKYLSLNEDLNKNLLEWEISQLTYDISEVCEYRIFLESSSFNFSEDYIIMTTNDKNELNLCERRSAFNSNVSMKTSEETIIQVKETLSIIKELVCPTSKQNYISIENNKISIKSFTIPVNLSLEYSKFHENNEVEYNIHGLHISLTEQLINEIQPQFNGILYDLQSKLNNEVFHLNILKERVIEVGRYCEGCKQNFSFPVEYSHCLVTKVFFCNNCSQDEGNQNLCAFNPLYISLSEKTCFKVVEYLYEKFKIVSNSDTLSQQIRCHVCKEHGASFLSLQKIAIPDLFFMCEACLIKLRTRAIQNFNESKKMLNLLLVFLKEDHDDKNLFFRKLIKSNKSLELKSIPKISSGMLNTIEY
jgi:hypothetical protein